MRTLIEGQVEVGSVLPDLEVVLTPAAIAAMAPAMMDFTPVYRNGGRARAQGSKDTFLNILTTMGLVERYVTDWAGPEALIRGINVKLGVPAYSGDTLTFTGTVVACEDGEFTVRVRGAVSLGDHTSGTVRFAISER